MRVYSLLLVALINWAAPCLTQKLYGGSFSDLKAANIVGGVLHIEGSEKKIVLYGEGLDTVNYAELTTTYMDQGEICDNYGIPVFLNILHPSAGSGKVAYLEVVKSRLFPQNELLYVCLYLNSTNNQDKKAWSHQGSALIIQLTSNGIQLPMWASIVVCIILIALSGLFSGLNLGLMSISPGELKLIMVTGTPSERHNAKLLLPLRKKGNVLLCAILFGNTIVNSATTILLDSMTNGVYAVVITTLTVVIFGEIIPQSVCARHGLAIGAKTRFFTWILIVVTAPVSYPLGLLLDRIIGHETPTLYNRHQLLEMVRMNIEGNLEADEAGIICGALKFKSKKVLEVMTPLERVFMINENSILDYHTIASVVNSGYSRIPVFSGDAKNIVALLHVKDLTFIDPDDMVPLVSVLNFYNHPLIKVFSDTTIDLVLKEFKKGVGHLAIVIEVRSVDNKDPTYEALGIVTLEDIIEEIIQSEISDETDVENINNPNHLGSGSNNAKNSHHQTKLHHHRTRHFFNSSYQAAPELTPNMIHTICQFMSTAISYFSTEHISHNILRRLITHPGVAILQDASEGEFFLYKKGVSADYFVLVIEGKVEVTVGAENHSFVQGAFSYFGQTCLTSAIDSESSSPHSKSTSKAFVSDFSMRLLGKVGFLKIPASLYNVAVRASALDRNRKQNGDSTEDIWDKFAKDQKIEADDPTTRSVSSVEGPSIIFIKNQSPARDRDVQ